MEHCILGVTGGLGGRAPGRGQTWTHLMPGQSFSAKYPGLIDCGAGAFRRPYQWRGKWTNRYFQEAECQHCGTVTLKDRNNVRRSKRIFCSPLCRAAVLQVQRAGQKFKKERPDGVGHHVQVRHYTHPRRGRHKLVYEHVLVMEAKIGRYVTADERVHHINCIKNDNRPENLFLCSNDAEHFRIHGSLNACVSVLIEMGALYFDEAQRRYRVRTDEAPQ